MKYVGFDQSASNVIDEICHERRLTPDQTEFVFRILDDAPDADVAALVSCVASALHQMGDTTDLLFRFAVLLAEKQNLTALHPLSAVLGRRKQNITPEISQFLSRMDQFRTTDGPLRSSLAALDILILLSFEPHELIADLLKCIEQPSSPLLINFRRIITRINASQRIKNVKSSILWLSKLREFSEQEREFLSNLVSRLPIMNFRIISNYISRIENDNYSETRKFVHNLLLDSLEEIFAETNIPLDRQDILIERITDVLVDGEALELTGRRSLSPTGFPREAPVKWKDRNPGESAPDFTRRVYGPWLASGISKRALRELDAALVNELNAWVRNGNVMPSDVRILTVSEENKMLIESGPARIAEHLGKFTGEEARREAERLRVAKSRLQP